MEKVIFVDKFIQYPKNFSKIASFLTNRSVQDCVRFYYDSKAAIPYKALLREADNRKRHTRISWVYSIVAAHSVGCQLYPPINPDDMEPLVELPVDDATYCSFPNHPPYQAVALGIPHEPPLLALGKSQSCPTVDMLRTTTVVDMERRLRKQIAMAIEDNDDLPSISPVLLATMKRHPPSSVGGRGSNEQGSSGSSSGGVDDVFDVDHRITPCTPSYLATADAMLRMYSAAAVMPTHLHTPLLGIIFIP